ncbi:MAG: nucleoside recognition domain-containing protein, partial [Bacillota bacterium]
DGIIGGVGAVVGFLPLIMVLFFLLALLEDCGYMARVAVVMDRFFKKVGLSGKSIIPMIIGTGCAIPGVMATRTIKNQRQRRTTAMLTPFMPCGAKLPVIALFAGVFFNEAAWVGTTMYFMAIVIIVVSSLIVLRITGETNSRSFFIMELPEYKIPSVKRATISMFSRAKAFIIKAGTIILLCNMAIQIMQTFNWRFQVVAEGAEGSSILASIASPFAILLVPLGFGAWQLAAAAITGFIAKENVVGTLAVVYGITNFIDPEELALVSGSASVAEVMGLTSVAALSYLMFNLFTPPCFAAIGAMNSEMENKQWLWGAIGFQFGMGYAVAFLTYQIGTLLTTGSFGNGFLAGLIVVLAMIGAVVYLVRQGKQRAAKN